MATHSTIHAWKIPWSVKPGSYSLQDLRELDTTMHAHIHAAKMKALQGQELFLFCPHLLSQSLEKTLPNSWFVFNKIFLHSCGQVCVCVNLGSEKNGERKFQGQRRKKSCWTRMSQGDQTMQEYQEIKFIYSLSEEIYIFFLCLYINLYISYIFSSIYTHTYYTHPEKSRVEIAV